MRAPHCGDAGLVFFSRFTGKIAAFSFQTSFQGIPWVRKEIEKGKLLIERQLLTINLDHLRYQRELPLWRVEET
jgi:hypothetical protein